jgi:alanyl-tRNA synthetase
MESRKVRQTFLDFFKSKGHEIVPSAPMVVKNDPTLMFNNSGMAPFKDLFLGNAPIKFPRVADTQKCLRVSGKHNDLEEVGVDTYHHTMFEMLGNWSFGDYFKKEAIAWAWELLTDVYKLDKDRLYVTVFEGDAKEGLAFDQEAYDTWAKFIDPKRILNGNKKDNFWEMGDTGPCGPCSEIHVDLRSDEERKNTDGATLVNNDHPQVIEIWNNVFMEFERRADGSLVKLPKQHVDTGMGFERLCRAIEGKSSNYDTDVFQPLIQHVAQQSGKAYGVDEKTDIAIRVLSDHIRTISFAIADGQLPSNNKAGYVIRRILRRAVRYYYTFLEVKEPLLCGMVPVLVREMGDVFPELKAQQGLIENVIKEEETAFLRTLGNGIVRFSNHIKSLNSAIIDGAFAFELYDTFGFPIDLTELIAREQNLSVNMEEFKACMAQQKSRSRAAAAVDTEDWVILDADAESVFVGYDLLETETEIIKFRKVSRVVGSKNKEQYQLVLSRTPFYAESGGQVGDKGKLIPIAIGNENEFVEITDTKKENGITIHFADKLPSDLSVTFLAQVNANERALTENNHSATHLMHAALRNILGTHVEQKGSLVNDKNLRFDFSHFSKVSNEEVAAIEQMVNKKIRENIALQVELMSIDDARKTGAMALFGEKYGDVVRVVTFDKNYSIELCGGTHVKSTGQIGLFKIVSEGAVAAGVRRIEAITANAAEEYFNQNLATLNLVKEALKNPKDVLKSVDALLDENTKLTKQIEALMREKAKAIKATLLSNVKEVNGVNFISAIIELNSAEAIKDLCFLLKQTPNTAIALGAVMNDKAQLFIAMSDDLVNDKKLSAAAIVKEVSKEINGGGGGSPAFATAGGTKKEGVLLSLEKIKDLL